MSKSSLIVLLLAGCASQPLTTPEGPVDMARPIVGDPDLSQPIVGDPDLSQPGGCLENDWTITSTSMGSAGGVVRFTAGQIYVWAPGAPPPSAPAGIAEYHLIDTSSDSGVYPLPMIALDSSEGLGCDDNATFRQSRTADCKTLVLTADIDNCTGAREYLDDEVELQR